MGNARDPTDHPATTETYPFPMFLTFKIAAQGCLERVSGGPFSSGAIVTALSFVLALCWKQIRPYAIFVWTCFFKPISKKGDTQQHHLDSFYQAQADVYDATRHRLLRGRHTLLRLCAAHLRQMKAENPTKPLVWVDIGGGTGFNIEEMDKYFPISEFDAVYLIDLCQPLLEVARRRFATHKWHHVYVLCQDATFFSLPEWEADPTRARGSVSLFTMSYSLSMIPSYLALLDRIDELLDPTGLLGVADFYTSSKASTPLERAIGNGNERRTGWFNGWFWQIWFDFDHVSLSPARREYLEYRFGTIKSYNGRNHLIPWLIQIPYYVFLGCSRSRSTARALEAFEIEAGNTAGSGHVTPINSPALSAGSSPFVFPSSPASSTSSSSTVVDMPELSLGPAAIECAPKEDARRSKFGDLAFPLSSFHYHSRHWRVPFLEKKEHGDFRTWIYGFTWEDPDVDMKYLKINRNDSLFVITSAGDNALHYAIAAQPRRIHCVDMNPCQGHLLELKLAAASALTYEEFWAMFGEGKLENFEDILDLKLSPFLSSVAYQFWRANAGAFRSSFHMCGYSGHALRLAKWAVFFGGVRKWVERFVHAETLEEQGQIWDEHIKPALLAPWIIKLFLANPVFLWNALGVPINQMNCFLDEGTTVQQYAEDTLDPIAHKTHMRTGAYHYLLCLLGRYTPQSCPLFLTRSGYTKLQEHNAALLNAFRLHTESIQTVLEGLSDSCITKMVLMDHMDWFDPKAGEACQLDPEIVQIKRVLAKGGAVYWRSAAKRPWYIAKFEKHGFRVEPLAIRGSIEPIDRVNMYASFYRATKL